MRCNKSRAVRVCVCRQIFYPLELDVSRKIWFKLPIFWITSFDNQNLEANTDVSPSQKNFRNDLDINIENSKIQILTLIWMFKLITTTTCLFLTMIWCSIAILYMVSFQWCYRLYDLKYVIYSTAFGPTVILVGLHSSIPNLVSKLLIKVG